MKLIRFYIRVVDRVSDLVGMTVSILIPVMALVVCYEVVLRYFFREPTVWAFDTAIFIFGYVGLLGGAYVLKRREHINVDVFHHKLSRRGQAVIDSLTAPRIFFFLILVVIYGWESAITGISRGIRRPTEWGPPLGHYLMLLPVSASLLILQGLANWLRDLHLALTGRDVEL